MSGRLASILIAIAVVVVLIANSSFVVSPGQRALVLQFGRIVGDNYGPGLHFKLPFVQDAEVYDGRILTLDNQTHSFSTADKKNLEIAYYAKWQIVDPDTYYQAAGGQELLAMDRLSAILNRGLRNEFAKVSEDQAIVAGGQSMLKGLGPDTLKQVKALGIKLIDLRVSGVHLPAASLDGVYDHMRQERQALATRTRETAAAAAAKTRGDADAEAAHVLAAAHLKAEQIRGTGDAQAARIFAAGYAQNPKFFSFYRSLRAYREAMSKGDDVLVLSTSSPFFKYLQADTAGK
ncbi:MAG TPA: protease modulator HflC [Nevskiaceae bacterium]|nr:protease modulator HflC [Nevskiaceae bacterium]